MPRLHRKSWVDPFSGRRTGNCGAGEAIGASYGEVTGITQTVRNYASAMGIAVLGTALTTVLTHRLTSSLTARGVPTSAVDAAAAG